MSKIDRLKKLDRMAGPLTVSLVRLLPPRKASDEKPTRILIIRPGGIGDAVLLIPAILQIKNAFPKAEIHLLAEKRNHEILSLCQDIDRIFCYDRFKELTQVLLNRYDAVIDTEQWYRLSAVIAYWTRAPLRIGFATNERKKLFNKQVPYNQEMNEISSFLSLAEALTGTPAKEVKTPFLHIPEALEKKVGPLIESFSGEKLVALFPGGSREEKKWPLEKFRELALQLNRSGHPLVIVGGEKDVLAGQQITEGLSSTLNLAGKLSLPETAALLRDAHLLITNDSGIMHVAYAVGTATLSLFGPGNEKKWAPKGTRHAVISKELDCRPCSRYGSIPSCETDVECLKTIEVEEVYQKTIELLKDI